MSLNYQPFTSNPHDLSEEEQARVMDECMQTAASCTVGLAGLRVKQNQEHVVSLGSGTSVVIHGQHGILTATHVLHDLPDSGEVGIIQFADGSDAVPTRPTIRMEQCGKFIVPGYCGAQLGSDIAFLTLPDTAVAMLESGGMFLNLDRRRDEALSLPRKGGYCVDGVSGVIGAWTTEEDPEGSFSRVIRFSALYGVGGLTDPGMSGDFDFRDVVVSFEHQENSPPSFGGISGGGLLRFQFNRENDGTLTKPVCTPIGVAFWQDFNEKGERLVRSHGPKSLYNVLYDYVGDKLQVVPPSIV